MMQDQRVARVFNDSKENIMDNLSHPYSIHDDSLMWLLGPEVRNNELQLNSGAGITTRNAVPQKVAIMRRMTGHAHGDIRSGIPVESTGCANLWDTDKARNENSNGFGQHWQSDTSCGMTGNGGYINAEPEIFAFQKNIISATRLADAGAYGPGWSPSVPMPQDLPLPFSNIALKSKTGKADSANACHIDSAPQLPTQLTMKGMSGMRSPPPTQLRFCRNDRPQKPVRLKCKALVHRIFSGFVHDCQEDRKLGTKFVMMEQQLQWELMGADELTKNYALGVFRAACKDALPEGSFAFEPAPSAINVPTKMAVSAEKCGFPLLHMQAQPRLDPMLIEAPVSWMECGSRLATGKQAMGFHNTQLCA